MKAFLLFVVSSLLLLSCNFSGDAGAASAEGAKLGRQELPGCWQLIEVRSAQGPKGFKKRGVQAPDTIPSKAPSNENALVSNDLLYNFFNDGSYTRIQKEGKYEQGTWSLDRKTNTLHFKVDGRKDPLDAYISGLQSDTMAITMQLEKGGPRITYLMQLVCKALPDPKQDPFHPSNCGWRIQPQAPEDEKAIDARRKAMLIHHALILESAMAREQRSVSFEFTPSCIQIYNGGIGIRHEQRIGPWFYGCFYSKEQADVALERIKKHIVPPRAAKPRTKNWFVDDAKVLREVAGEF